MIDQETKQRILEAARIEEVVGEFVSLKKRGANYVGCCPFHTEKTPSFSVSPTKGFFKCFGCGESGDSVGFLMKHEHFTFPEALQYLAKKYNIEIREEEVSDEQRQRDSERDALFHVTEFAQQYFSSLLFDDEMGRAVGLSYFHSRGLNDAVIRKFGLGYCMDEWRAFSDHARANAYSDTVLEKSGLTIFKEDGKYYDRFRGRVMFPIYSIAGRVLGFSGRVLSKEKQAAKYVNSPESDIYTKGRILYGLYQAKSAIAKLDKCYLVEGNVDVVSMFQSGVENAVASCGTALTYEQIRLIKRYTSNVTILYDGDAAGIHASQRAVKMLYEEGMHVRLVLFPDQEDPDSYAQKYGSTQLQQYLKDHEENFILYQTHVLQDNIKADPIKKGEFVRDLVETIALVPDLLERSAYITQCSALLEVPEQTLSSELASAMLRNKLKNGNAGSTPATEPGQEPDQPYSEPTQQPDSSEWVPSDLHGPKAPHQSLNTQVSTLQYCEQQVIAYLLNYGDRDIHPIWVDENNEKQVSTITVSQFIVSQLDPERPEFTNPLNQKIYEMFAQSSDPISCSYFTTHSDDTLRSYAIALMKDDYELSNGWFDKYLISVPKADNNLTQAVLDVVNSFRMASLDHLLAENAQRLKEEDLSEGELQEALEERQYLLNLRVKLAQALNRIYY